MGKSSTPAPQPDPNIGKAAILQAETGKEWLGFARDAFAVSETRQQELDALTRRVGEMQLGVAQDQLEYSREDRERYESTFKPIEDEFVDEATNYASEERQAEAAARARADVQKASADARQTSQRTAAGLGISPASGRYAGIDRATDLGTTLGVADAENRARTAIQDKGLALKADVVNMGRGLPTQSAQAASIGLGSAGGALSGAGAANSQYIASTGIMGQGFQGQMSGYAGMGSTLNQQYSTQVSAWEAEQRMKAANSQGLGSAIGGIAGMIFSSDEDGKENKASIKDGKALAAVNDMPVEEWDYKEGVADEGRHVGTYAQDFQRATGLGNGKEIAAIDAVGVTMKAVQDLDDKVDKIAAAVGIGMNDNRPAPKKARQKEAVAA